ncbi:MAG: DUF892 family protein [Phycisphaerales bacterium]|nr:DUF892 family protein [Phycisphaerales bacterium]
MTRTPAEELVHFLSDMYSVELQALAQLVSAPEMAGDDFIAEQFRLHYAETRQQAALVHELLEARGGEPSALKDAIMRTGGKSFLLFARALPETPGRLVAHSYSYEAMEWAGYEMLKRLAAQAEDAQVEHVAHEIAAQEHTMMERLEACFDRAEQASHGDTAPDEFGDQLRKHLKEAHALEMQANKLLERARHMSPQGANFDQACRNMLSEAREHAGSDASNVLDAAMAFGGFNWGVFFQVQTDRPAKMAAFAFAFLHLQIGGYELLLRFARRAGDGRSEQICRQVLGDKRALAARLGGTFDDAVEVTLETMNTAQAMSWSGRRSTSQRTAD